MRDIVYCLKSPLPLGGEELRYSLRTLRNLPHGKVWMVTPQLPEWVNPDTVGHIEWEQKDGKYVDLSAKWLAMPTWNFLPNKIIYMDDDMYIVRKAQKAEACHNISLNAMLKVTAELDRRNLGGFDYHEALVNTFRRLQEVTNGPIYSPVQHNPFPLERNNIPIKWEDGNGPYEYKTMTYNHRNTKPKFMFGECKAQTNAEMVRILQRGHPWLSSDDNANFHTSGIASYLKRYFPEPSKYEL